VIDSETAMAIASLRSEIAMLRVERDTDRPFPVWANQRVNHFIPEADGSGAISDLAWAVGLSGLTATVLPGLRVVIGGTSSVEPATVTLTLTQDNVDNGCWIVKQYSGSLGQWIESLQVYDAAPNDEGNANSIDFLTEFYEVFPDTLNRQRRPIAYISAGGAVSQYAFGTIYVIGRSDDSTQGDGDDVTETDADIADQVECDQNIHPGADAYATGTGTGTDGDGTNHPGDNDPVVGDGTGDSGDSDHPGAADCYTTR
jgi:hypothetical protein